MILRIDARISSIEGSLAFCIVRDQETIRIRENISWARYESGHMMYLLDKDSRKLREDIVGWLRVK